MNSDKIPDAWWASLARRLLHPVQLQIIEVLWRHDRPLSACDLAALLDGATSQRLAHHLRRLRAIGAVAYAEKPKSRRAENLPYCLNMRLPNHDR